MMDDWGSDGGEEVPVSDQPCGHEGCKCTAREDGFCSDYCHKHGTHEGHKPHACGCGHPECG